MFVSHDVTNLAAELETFWIRTWQTLGLSWVVTVGAAQSPHLEREALVLHLIDSAFISGDFVLSV